MNQPTDNLPAADGSRHPCEDEVERSDTRNGIALKSFTNYCLRHPSERFWQALRNWSRWQFILGSNDRNGATIDTFNIEGLSGTSEDEQEVSAGNE